MIKETEGWVVEVFLYFLFINSMKGIMTEDKIEFWEEMKKRIKQFALRVIKLYQSLSKAGEAQEMEKQLLRSATSVAANYRAVCRTRSGRELYSKLCIVVEEAEERSSGWNFLPRLTLLNWINFNP